tara:strand:- start:652 stop:1041 length:390 start_codon:yes stop_codon:yes gene_type:complete
MSTFESSPTRFVDTSLRHAAAPGARANSTRAGARVERARLAAKIERLRAAHADDEKQLDVVLHERGMARVRRIRSVGEMCCVTAARRTLLKKFEKNADQLTPIETFVVMQMCALSAQRAMLAAVLRTIS